MYSRRVPWKVWALLAAYEAWTGLLLWWAVRMALFGG